jgi:hypothetical protein
MKANATGSFVKLPQCSIIAGGPQLRMRPMHTDIIERARRYLAKMPPAIQGSGGSTATFNAALALHGFGLTGEPAMRLFNEWNATHCTPPWKETDLLRKLTDAAKCARKPAGHLLKEATATPWPMDEGTQKAAKRGQWPALYRPTGKDLAVIADLRHVSLDAVALADAHRHLWRCQWKDAECLAIRFGRFAQVRRMDGQPFIQKDGSSIKALNLPGSEGSFLNPGGMGAQEVPVILTEGAISILEGAETVQRADGNSRPLHSAAVLAAVSASSKFTAGHLAKLKGRRVRIIPDADPAGQDAAAHWSVQLRTVGCGVDCVRMPAGCKDLGDALRLLPAGDSFWRQLLTF